MGKRRKRKSPPPVADALKRHCPKCGTRIVHDKQGRPWIMVWAGRSLRGPKCVWCDTTALPADHWHAGCQQCGHRWTEPVDTLASPEE